jgi:hypothetical protein
MPKLTPSARRRLLAGLSPWLLGGLVATAADDSGLALTNAEGTLRFSLEVKKGAAAAARP